MWSSFVLVQQFCDQSMCTVWHAQYDFITRHMYSSSSIAGVYNVRQKETCSRVIYKGLEYPCQTVQELSESVPRALWRLYLISWYGTG